MARQYYYPYGAERPVGTGTLPTDHTYTGQISDGTGLMYYVSRYYDAYLNRWIQPDPIVPKPGNPQDLNRYANVLSNPLKFKDPTGHVAMCTGACDEGNWSPALSAYGVSMSPEANFTLFEKLYIIAGVIQVANQLAEASTMVETAAEAFRAVFGLSTDNPMTIRRCAEGECSKLGWTVSSTEIAFNNFYTSGNSVEKSIHLMVHELGHAFNGRVSNVVGQSYYTYNALARTQAADPAFPNRINDDPDLTGFAGPRYNWQQSPSGSPGEEYADMFLGWTYNRWETLPNNLDLTLAGQARSAWMTANMPLWVNLAIDP